MQITAFSEIGPESLNNLLRFISPVERSIILMRYQDGLSFEEIAVLRKITCADLKIEMHRIESKLVRLSETSNK